MYSLDDTIAAVASAPGGAARGIVRLSGTDSLECVEKFFRPTDVARTPANESPYAIVGSFQLPGFFSPLPCDLYVWPNCRSYTGQPLVEIHTIGSPPLLQSLLQALCTAGTRPAGPGEFTMRAFLCGRIDLPQAEAVLGVIDAGNQRELNVALRQLAGGLSRPMHQLRDSLLDLLAHVEAGFDFADEDLPFITRDELDRGLAEAAAKVAAVERQLKTRAETTDFTRVVLAGRPNTGKSSLFNALAGDGTAIVSEHAGTTRDFLSVELDIEGVKCLLVDTAGMRGEGDAASRPLKKGTGSEPNLVNTAENDACEVPVPLFQRTASIEHAAEELAVQKGQEADVVLMCLDSTRDLDQWERDELAREDRRRIPVLTKCDAERKTNFSRAAIDTSAKTGIGMEKLKTEIRAMVLASTESSGDAVVGTTARCADSLRCAAECLNHARNAAATARDELVAAELRGALDELGKVVGAVYTDDVLERIFSRFCVGK